MIFVLLSSFLIQSCDISHSLYEKSGTGNISVSVSLDQAIASADLSQEDFSFVIYGNGPGTETFQVSTGQNVDSATVEDLAFGTWNITVEALYHDGAADPVSFGDGVAAAEVHPDSTTICSVDIAPFEGQGNFDITVNWNSVQVADPQMEGTLSRIGYDETTQISFTMSSGQAAAYLEGLDSGIYSLALTLNDGADYKFGGAASSIRITNALTTTAVYTITGTPAPDSEAPSVPGNLRATSILSNRVTLAWDASTDNVGVTGYRVYRGGAAIGTSVSTTYTDSTVLPDSTYSYTVSAYDAADNVSGQSGSVLVNTPAVIIGDQIIADHTVVDRYDDIPTYYINEVKKMLVDMVGESHSGAYRFGPELLEMLDSRFQVTTFSWATPPSASSDYLRIGGHTGVGEAIWYANATNRNQMKDAIAARHNAGNPYHVMGFGWCWDMTWENAPGGDRDPVYNVRWAGSSDGGPEGNLRWGLDADDYSLTGNTVCMDTYLNATQEYIDYCTTNNYDCKVIFTTGPVDGNSGSEKGYQREIKHDYIRAFVQADSSRILFDYADILCWNDDGEQNISTWNDGGTPRTHAQIHSDNMMDYVDPANGNWTPTSSSDSDGDHIGQVGALRIAKAMWWMLARIEGWDGN